MRNNHFIAFLEVRQQKEFR